MVSANEISFGDLVRVVALEPEGYAHSPRLLNLVLSGQHPLVGKIGIVDTVSDNTVKVLIEGKVMEFCLCEVEKVKECPI